MIGPADSGEWLHSFHSSLTTWGVANFRAFEWRTTTDPYHILVAEVLLHRTQVSQVVPVYRKMLSHYPTIESLAAADLPALHDLLRPLGLPQRVPLMLSMAQDILNRFAGEIPADRTLLLSLPGVSDYIASAVRCFAWNYPEALVDTNTVRVAGRIFAYPVKDSSRRNRIVRHLLLSLLDSEAPREYIYALLDLAHAICQARRPPECNRCPVVQFCRTGRQKLQLADDGSSLE